MHRIQLAGFWPLAYTVGVDGSLALLGGDRGGVTTLVTVGAEGSYHIEPLAYIGDAWRAHLPTLLALPAGGYAVIRRLWQRSGWKRESGKHGMYGRFTGDGRFCILRPAFASGDWKGRTRVLSLADVDADMDADWAEPPLLEPVLPRGLTRAQLLDHHPTSGWWLLAGSSPNAEIVTASELELRPAPH